MKNKTIVTPKLTISIPTWNRAEYLRENIVSMLPGIQALPAGTIEIFVSDNASTDGTAEFLAEMSRTHSFIRYIRQTENIGANANFYTVLNEAKGDYVWLMGDDDHINPACLSQILADIEQYQPGVMIGGTERDTQQKRIYLPKVQTHLLSDERILLDYDGFVLAGKMSVLIFSKTALNSVLEEGWRMIQAINTPWPHLVWLFKLLAKKHSILVLPYTTNYIIEKNRYNLLQCGVVRIELMFMDYTRMLLSVLHDFSQDMHSALLSRIVKGRHAELMKILAYATYLNPYFETIQNAFAALSVIPLWKNRIRFMSFYLFPSLTPIFIRKFLLHSVRRIKPQWHEYQDFLNFLTEVKIRRQNANSRAVFNKAYLNKAD